MSNLLPIQQNGPPPGNLSFRRQEELDARGREAFYSSDSRNRRGDAPVPLIHPGGKSPRGSTPRHAITLWSCSSADWVGQPKSRFATDYSLGRLETWGDQVSYHGLPRARIFQGRRGRSPPVGLTALKPEAGKVESDRKRSVLGKKRKEFVGTIPGLPSPKRSRGVVSPAGRKPDRRPGIRSRATELAAMQGRERVVRRNPHPSPQRSRSGEEEVRAKKGKGDWFTLDKPLEKGRKLEQSPSRGLLRSRSRRRTPSQSPGSAPSKKTLHNLHS